MMETDRWRLVKQIFHDALDRPQHARERYLVDTCADDRQLRAEVEALLAAHDEAGGFLSSPTAAGPAEPEAAPPREVFQRLQRTLAGRFSLERELGRGGMAIVFLARDVALDRPVAVKLLPPHLAGAPAFRERFLREARTAAGLSHPHIVPIHLVEERDGLVYFVMAFVEGETLGDRVRRAGPLKPADAARLLQEVAWALGYAHGRGVIHRDIKPDNILIDRGSGRAMVTDFGIARLTDAGTVSQQGEVLGTLQYMSPEQASADSVIDGRADLYSLGVTAFFALTGRLPFESRNPAALMAMHIGEPAPPVRSVSTGVPARLAEAVDRCLAKDPAGRPPTGEALAEAIAEAQVTRREIAPSVREFLGAAKNGAAQIAGLWFVWLGVAAVGPRIGSAQPGLIGGPLDPLVAILAGLTPFVMIRPILAARGVLRAGLDERDVADAAALSLSARDANVDYELARIERLGSRLATLPGRALFFLLSSLVLWFPIFPVLFFQVVHRGFSLPGLASLVWLLLVAAIEAFLISLAIAPRRTLALATRGTPENMSLIRRLWAGPLGRWIFQLAGVGLRRSPSLPAPDSAPTEVLLGRAASELFDQLPRDERHGLGDVHDVIRSLERAAAGLRLRRDALQKGLAEAGAAGSSPRRAEVIAQLESARTAAEQRLGTAVAALENLRLDLLRLRAGLGSPDDLTDSIEEARSVGAAVDAELAARREVETLIRGPMARAGSGKRS